jgi:hypothetical protein
MPMRNLARMEAGKLAAMREKARAFLASEEMKEGVLF